MIYSTETPLSQYADSPDFADNATQRNLALLGYKQDGTQNLWGKMTSFGSFNSLATNKLASSIAEKAGATDTMANIQQDFDNRLNKMGLVLGVLQGAGGATTGNPQMVIQGLNTTTQFGGALAFDQNDLVTEGQYIYR